MKDMKRYKAPWGRMLIVTSAMVTVVCVGVSVGILWVTLAKHGPFLVGALALLPLVLVVGALPFMVRGYTITADVILIHRPFWDTSLPRRGLESATVEPDAMRGSLKTWGNGGGFSFTGSFYNPRLHFYRAFVTDLHRTVVLRYPSRTIVLSPAAPDAFVSDLGLLGRPRLNRHR
jgi:Bacterial PH domain